MADRASGKADVLQGTLELMILQMLDTLGPLHGHAIAARIVRASGGALPLNMGTPYPGLTRMEQRGFVRARWAVTKTNRRARFCSITAAGRRQLSNAREAWDRMATLIHTLLNERL